MRKESRAELAQNPAPVPGGMTRAAKDAQGVQQYTPRARGGESELELALFEPGVSRAEPVEEDEDR